MVGPFSSPKRCRKGSRERERNPYSDRGLDKFSALLSELDEKRQSIYATRIDSDGPPLVRFVFKSSGECVPVIIKTKKAMIKKDVQDEFKVKAESKQEEDKEMKKAEEKQRCVVLNHFLPVTVILVLVFLVFFGRSVSIMCTCVVWYLVPLIKEQSGNRGTTYKKNKLSIQSRPSFKALDQ